MSEPQLISPLLDGFVMGDPISEHDGVRCCPAMHLETEKKYIVKVISVPASNTKLAAMLLAGAFPDREAALSYFEDLAGDVMEETALLQKLSRFEGFLSYEGCQLVPMESGDGFDIYLLGAYRPTLEGLLRRNDMTHLAAVNLGLDLCAALSVCRRMGYMYADLRPSNVYICNDREYRIGDLGFLSLSSLEYASLPEKYLSSYTPPEISDAYSALNSTMDTYAVGLLLYQAFNDGQLPFEGRAPAGSLIAPRYADHALSELILKACAPKPEDRWQDPTQMGQALIHYLQTNTVNDTPIVPPAPQEEPEPEEIENSEPSTADILAQVDEALDAAPECVSSPEEPSEEVLEEVPEEASEEAVAEEPIPADIQPEETAAEEVSADGPDAPQEEPAEPQDIPEEAGEAEPQENSGPEPEELTPAASESEAETAEAEDAAEGSAPEEDNSEASDESESAEPARENSQEETSEAEDTADILAQADDLIAHQLPGPVVSPEPADISSSEDPPEEASAESDTDDTSNEAAQPEASEEPVPPEDEATPRKHAGRNNLLTGLIIGILIGLLCIGGFLFYKNYFLQTVYDMTLGGTEDKLTVTLNSQIDDSLLTVLCTDPHGNTIRGAVEQGVATFTNLKPNTQYKIQVRINGFHKLQGKITETYTTASQTTIGSFYAATGHEDGSVILSFTVQGPDSNHWVVRYFAEGEEEKTSDPFTGHMLTLNGLTVGKLYTFTLEPVSELYLSGTDTITHIPSKLVLARNLHVVGLQDEGLSVEWSAPEGVSVPQWTVRCYNDAGYDKTLTVAEPKALFDGVDSTSAYTIEVTASGMTLSERTYLSANSITFQQIWVDGSSQTEIVVAWDYYGTEPAGGWLLLYSVDGSSEQKVVQCQTNRGVITPLLPGSKYSIVIQPANGSTVFGGTTEYQALTANVFSGYQVSASNISFSMCVTPSVSNWDRYDVPDEDYKTAFAPGVSASFVMHLNKEYNESDDEIVTLYLIRDESGNLVSNATESRTWTSMWYKSYGKLTIPFMPDAAGKYTVEIYFNGTAVTTQSFELLAE